MITENPHEILKKIYQHGVIRAIDYHFALFLYQLHPDPLLTLAGALTSFETACGNTCLDLSQYGKSRNGLKRKTLFGLPVKDHQHLIKTLKIPLSHWIKKLRESPATSDGNKPAPLIINDQRIYLHKHFVHETFIIEWLQKQKYLKQVDFDRCRLWLDRLFPENNEQEPNWQKMAAALASLTSFSIISGGPGTGKTTTVTRLMALLIALAKDNEKPPVIMLSAPTGKAAARLAESVGMACETLDCPNYIKDLIPRQAKTIHRLLGAFSTSHRFLHNAQNPLHLNVLIVDEASMVDQMMMSRLLQALPTNARLILLGDKDQLSSVEAGSFLGSLCELSHKGYTLDMKKILHKVTGYDLNGTHEPAILSNQNGKTKQKTSLNNHLCLLKKSYRFKEGSGIARFAAAVNTGNLKEIDTLCNSNYHDLKLHTDTIDMKLIAELSVEGYSPYLKTITKKGSIEKIHEQFNRFQVLCALRDGPYGIDGLNQLIFQTLIKKKQLFSTASFWYPGCPVMIARNDPALSLSNGDIGITLEEDNKLRVAFTLPEGQIKKMIPARLPAHEVAFAMTVHKSQGSEFDHVVLVLPDHNSPLLTRELLYTGITRARKKLDIFATVQTIRNAVNSRTQRTSGLMDRLETRLDSPERDIKSNIEPD